eukprot:jgi/Botrbrau1/15554/Bobra.0273s0006.1
MWGHKLPVAASTLVAGVSAKILFDDSCDPCHQMAEDLQTMTICTGCRDHVDAARAGHLHCLAQLRERGLYLALRSRNWVSAGEARKSQVFEAAIAGCSSGRADVLAWLFSPGWARNIAAIWRWDTHDLWEQHEDFAEAFPGLSIDNEPFVLEYKLYCCAVQQPTPSCLEALLDAGCRSVWICRIAAREGKADFLALAAKRGCPCDFWVWQDAASTGKLAVLALLASDHAMRRIFKKACIGARSWQRLIFLAASQGQWECLQILERVGCEDRRKAAESAAWSGQLQILQNLVEQDPQLLQDSYFFDAAAQGGSLACLEFLEHAGCPWHENEVISAAESGSLEALHYCVQRSRDNLQSCDLGYVMMNAICARSPECMQAVYDYGYQWSPAESTRHPASIAIWENSLACLQLAVKLSGPPQITRGTVLRAAEIGEEMLRLVHELGGTLDSEAAEWAAEAGQAGALQYALQHGAPLSMRTFGGAVEGGSVECLKCAFEHGLAVGLPTDYHRPSEYLFLSPGSVTPSFRMLRYVCEVMRPAWVQLFLEHDSLLELQMLERGKHWWMMRLYMAKRMEGPLPWPLDKLVRMRRQRAGALAGVFYKAKKLAQAGAPSPSLALWGAMDRVPLELRERIAFEAHLICPVTQLGPL